MRELKFRAWDAESECYIDEKDWAGITPEGQNIWIVEEEEVSVLPILGEFIIEQYTGLKDKNGKEIYEGDIVEEKIDTGDYDIDGTYRYKVVWDDDMLCWSLDPNATSIHKDLWECNQSIKVIGNIHENPELLGGEE